MRKPYTKTLHSVFLVRDTPMTVFRLRSGWNCCRVWISQVFEEVFVDNFVVVPRMNDEVVWFMVRVDGGGFTGRDVGELCDGDIGGTEFGQYLRSQVTVRRVDVSDFSEYVKEELRLREIVEG
jgi:hypothetical protein